jgi:hypothetical protein
MTRPAKRRGHGAKNQLEAYHRNLEGQRRLRLERRGGKEFDGNDPEKIRARYVELRPWLKEGRKRKVKVEELEAEDWEIENEGEGGSGEG